MPVVASSAPAPAPAHVASSCGTARQTSAPFSSRCRAARSAGQGYGIERGGVRKPVLWVVDGCGLHEMEFCSDRRWTLAQRALAHFPRPVLRNYLVYQPVGGGFTMKAARRFKGDCAQINADQARRRGGTRHAHMCMCMPMCMLHMYACTCTCACAHPMYMGMCMCMCMLKCAWT